MSQASDQLLQHIHSLKRVQAAALFFQFIASLIILLFCFAPLAWIIYGNVYLEYATVKQIHAVSQYSQTYSIIFMMIIWIGLPAVGIFGALFNQQRYKLYTKVLGSLANSLPGDYTMATGIGLKSIEKSHLFPVIHKKKTTAHYVTSYGSIAGIVNDIPIRFSDITVNSNGLAESWIVRIITAVAPFNFLYMGFTTLRSLISGQYGQAVALRGLFFIAQLGTTLPSKTVIVPDRLEAKGTFLARVLQGLNMKRDDVVHLENPEFEKLFVTYSTDQIDARKIITLSFMERLVRLRQEKKQELLISVCDQYLYVFIPNKKGFFDAAISKSRTAAAAVEMLLEQLNFFIQLPAAIGIDHLLKKDPLVQAGLKDKLVIVDKKDIPIINP